MRPTPENPDPLGIIDTLPDGTRYHSLPALARQLGSDLSAMPYSLRILLESVCRNIDGRTITTDNAENLARQGSDSTTEIPFIPARVLMQDFTGVPAVVDLAVMRDALADLGGDPSKINPLIPVDLVIDHSVQVDRYASILALGVNAQKELERNRERYEFLRWGAQTFDNFRVVPPATGICHQVNLEYLSQVVRRRDIGGVKHAFPDSVVGTDSHTPMVDGLGVLAWGVGGIEAEAVMLGQPYYMLVPQVIGFELTGKLSPSATPTDVVLTITERLRECGVVGKFVEFFGPALDTMQVADRALISNMSPETGATALFFPVDRQSLAYLRHTARPDGLVGLVESYTHAQGLFRDESSPRPESASKAGMDLWAWERGMRSWGRRGPATDGSTEERSMLTTSAYSGRGEDSSRNRPWAVSYTHLTLPTILRV